MKRLLVGFSVLVLAILFATPLQAADEIRIVRGTLFQPLDTTGVLSVEGTSGVRIDAALSSSYATPEWKSSCYYHGCETGDVVSLGVSYGTSLLPFSTGTGQLTIRGQTYSLWTPDAADDLQMQFGGAFVVPELPEGDYYAEASAPFAFSGSLKVPNRLEPGTYDVFDLYGSGVATVTLRFEYDRWIVGSVTYDFVPRGTVITR